MLPNDMASKIIDALRGLSEPGGVDKLWSEVCSYVEDNAVVLYSWQGYTTSTPPSPDPYNFTGIQATIDTSLGNSLSLVGFDQVSTATEAMGKLSGAINQAVSLWMISFPSSFAVNPCFVIPSIVLTPSGADNQEDAMNALCSEIIDGLKLATPSIAGSNSPYVGVGGFSSIL